MIGSLNRPLCSVLSAAVQSSKLRHNSVDTKPVECSGASSQVNIRAEVIWVKKFDCELQEGRLGKRALKRKEDTTIVDACEL